MLGSPSVPAARDAPLGRAAWREPRRPPLKAWAWWAGAHRWGLQIPDVSLGWEREQEGSRAEAHRWPLCGEVREAPLTVQSGACWWKGSQGPSAHVGRASTSWTGGCSWQEYPHWNLRHGEELKTAGVGHREPWSMRRRGLGEPSPVSPAIESHIDFSPHLACPPRESGQQQSQGLCVGSGHWGREQASAEIQAPPLVLGHPYGFLRHHQSSAFQTRLPRSLGHF